MINTAPTLKPSEHQEQAAFFDYVLFQYQHDPTFIRPLFFAVPNGSWLGGKTPGARAALMQKMKGEGLTPGVSDLLYLQPRGVYSYLAIEMKTEKRRNEKDGGLSLEQVEFLHAAREAGALAVVCYGADEAIRAFDEYMGMVV